MFLLLRPELFWLLFLSLLLLLLRVTSPSLRPRSSKSHTHNLQMTEDLQSLILRSKWMMVSEVDSILLLEGINQYTSRPTSSPMEEVTVHILRPASLPPPLTDSTAISSHRLSSKPLCERDLHTVLDTALQTWSAGASGVLWVLCGRLHLPNHLRLHLTLVVRDSR